MAKFFLYAAAAALCATVLGSTAVEAQTTAKPACVPLNFTEKATDIKSLNAVIDLAIQSGLLKTNIPSAITVTNSAVSVVPFSVLGLDFELTPIIKSLNVTGVQNILPKHLNVSSANSVIVAADINGTVTVDGTITLQIQQLNHKWYEICWTNILNPSACPPATVDIDVDLAIVKPSLSSNTELNLVACAPGVATSVCKNVTVSDILIAALQSKFEPLLARLLKRFTSASVNSLTIYWESISKLNIDIAKSGSLINAILDQLVNFSVDIVNKKGDIYNTVIDVVQKLFTSILNKLFATSLAPQFGNTCYDA